MIADTPTQYYKDWTLSKMDFFRFWLGQKTIQTSWGGNPMDLSGYYSEFDNLASSLSAMLPQLGSYFLPDLSNLDVPATLTGELNATAKTGFYDPVGVIEQVEQWVYNTFAKPFIAPLENIWVTLMTCGNPLHCAIAVWNNIVAPALGSLIEDLKSVETIQQSLWLRKACMHCHF